MEPDFWLNVKLVLGQKRTPNWTRSKRKIGEARQTRAKRESHYEGVRPHGISYAWCRTRGLIAPERNVNMPRQLTMLSTHNTYPHACTPMEYYSVTRGNACVSSLTIASTHFLQRFFILHFSLKIQVYSHTRDAD